MYEKDILIKMKIKANELNSWILTLALLCFFLPVAFFAQDFSNAGTVSANFLKIPVEPIGEALGGSNVASVKGALGLYWNPAALASTEATEVVLSHVNWIADTKLSFAAISHNFGFGCFGLSLTALNVGQMEITTEDEPNGTGSYFNSGSYALGFSYAMNVIDRFSFGGTVKYVYEFIWDTHGTSYLFDFGSIYRTDFYNMRIGMRLANFGTNMTFSGSPIDEKPNVVARSGISYPYDPRLDRMSPEYSLPQLFNVGLSIDPLKLGDHRLTFTASVNDPNDYNVQMGFGCEYSFQDILFLRAGYKTGYDEQNFFSGLGLRLNAGIFNPQMDFAYASFGRLGNVALFSLTLAF